MRHTARAGALWTTPEAFAAVLGTLATTEWEEEVFWSCGHRQGLSRLFVQVLRLCACAGLIKLGHVSLDGTKIFAVASKHTLIAAQPEQLANLRQREEIAAAFL